MPPKGWKKNADPSEQPFRDTDPVLIDDILFPRSTILKLARSITLDEDNQNNMTLAKDSLLALQRSATVFVSYMLFHSKQVSKANGRKTVTAQDIMAALERAEFAGFLPEVKQRLAEFESMAKAKKQKKLEEKSAGKEEQEEGESENVTKKPRLDTADGDSLKPAASDTEDEGDDDDVVDDGNDVEVDNEDVEIREELSDEIEDGLDEDESAAANPISELDKDERELRGEEADDDRQSEGEDEDEDDEDAD